jgi:hypothetical protein
VAVVDDNADEIGRLASGWLREKADGPVQERVIGRDMTHGERFS